jgi:ATP-dependent helicase/nuclease subunit A
MTNESFAHLVIRASAGSGKTHQLTNRYLGLLAAGVSPEAMLATTFTRKAAAEILDRVLLRLAVAAGDAVATGALAKEIGKPIAGPRETTQLLRKLLARLHRVQIGTLDSFYIALAGSFSLELGLPAGWSIGEEADDAALRREALERLLEQQPEDILKLLPLLSKGESKRSVQGELRDVITRHHEVFLGSKQSAWACLRAAAPVAAAERTAALEQLGRFDLSVCRDKRFIDARNRDIGRFEQQDWSGFIGGGLAAKVAAKDPTYYKKPIPANAQSHYDILVQHAKSELLGKLADQTKATWDLLNRFDRELRSLKQGAGQLRFGEVTQALVDGLQQNVLAVDGLGFRLDAAVEHLLLDEFQDTALAQWLVLRPIAQRITGHSGLQIADVGLAKESATATRSFFCVGDVKQAIYGWRGGMAAILDTLRVHLGPLRETTLVESRRSAQPIIDVVNQVFRGLDQLDLGDNAQDGLANWQERFDEHTTARKEIPGYVCLHAGPERHDGQSLHDQRPAHYKYVAERVAALDRLAPGRSVGVLCRTNPAVARMIYELRNLKVEASEEGGIALTDSPAVELVLSLFTLADHPEHSVAWFHLQNSPLKAHSELSADRETFSRQLRQGLLADGCGKFTHSWARRIAPACDRRDLNRLQQVVDMAYAYQARSTLRADDFVAWVRQKRVPDPSGASVRVMTIHGAKGLQFDAVVLPELDCNLAGRAPAFVVGRDRKTLEVDFVCRYVQEIVQHLLDDDQRQAFERDRQQRIEESLSLLYVAMTRAVHALYLVIPGPYKGKFAGKTAWHNVLLQTLEANEVPMERKTIWERGDAKWFHKAGALPAATVPEGPRHAKHIAFGTMATERRRGMEHVAPSRREGQAQVALAHLFHPTPGTGTAAGTLYHAWFETIGWLDDGVPTEDALRATAEKQLVGLPAETHRDLDRLLADFRGWLQNPEISCVLRRSAYAGNSQPGFPAALARLWTKTMVPQQVERERRFLIRDGTKFLSGSLDRIVWLGDGERTVAADVIDFKTDAILPGDQAALAARTEHYRPQLEAYRQAVARLAQLPAERVAARLVFTCAGRVQEV